MTYAKDFITTRRTAILIALIILLLGSIAYFSTNVALRNNKMMYEEIYGKSTTLDSKNNLDSKNAVENTNVVNANSISTNAEAEKVKTALV